MFYESDAAPFVDEEEGYPRVTEEEATPLSYVVLASADLRPINVVPGEATMGFFVRNGGVFNGGTTEWVSQLDPITGDAIIRQVTSNVFQRLCQRLAWDWEDIGHAKFGTALTSANKKLFIATSENLLWRRYPVGAEVPWRRIGRVNNAVAMAAIQETLFCVTADNTLWWRSPFIEDAVSFYWTPVGTGPDAGTKALVGVGKMFYAIDANGQVWRTAASKTDPPSWTPTDKLDPDPTINAMAADNETVFSSTSDGRLLMSTSLGWKQIYHCYSSIGLAVIDKILFVATTGNRLWRLDLHGLR